MPNYHFENDEVIAAITGTDYLRQNVQRRLMGWTSGEKWSLYRAIVKLAAEQDKSGSVVKAQPGEDGCPCKHCGLPVFRSSLGVGPEWIHHDPMRMNCYGQEPWTTPEPVDPNESTNI